VAGRLTSWIDPLRVPPMPLEMMSVVLALATMHGNISDHRACTRKHARRRRRVIAS
jgi:hypothetical protein